LFVWPGLQLLARRGSSGLFPVSTAAAGAEAAVAGAAAVAEAWLPLPLLRRAGVAGVSLDFSLLTEREDDDLGEAVEAGTVILAGVVPSTDRVVSDPAGSVQGVRTLWKRLGLGPELLARRVVVTPTCGLAGASPAYARRALSHSVRAAQSLVDNPE